MKQKMKKKKKDIPKIDNEYMEELDITLISILVITII